MKTLGNIVAFCLLLTIIVGFSLWAQSCAHNTCTSHGGTFTTISTHHSGWACTYPSGR